MLPAAPPVVTPTLSSPVVDQAADHVVRNIPLHIDYTIIEHFSHHLYGSPNKAIEELVINGFDAFATEVRVFLDGAYSPGRIIVWDNGQSMDADGMEAMWRISDSPKRTQRTIAKGGKSRAVIGKFGIGKVASYTLGDSISHVCKRGNQYLAVRMDYDKLMESGGKSPATPAGGTPAASAEKSVAIFSLSQAEAEETIHKAFDTVPSSLSSMLAQDTWTFAIIEKLKSEKNITIGRLMWVLGNAMPLRPDFGVWVEDKPVVTTREKKNVARWGDMGEPSIQNSITERWKEALRDLKVEGDMPTFGTQVGLDPNTPTEAIPYVELSGLGKVWGRATLYRDSLKNSNADTDEQRSYGFFIMVLGRLINDEDAKFLLNDPSFGTFYRSQYVLNVDGLDEALLADRERIHTGTKKAKELAQLQHAIYLTTAAWKFQMDADEAEGESVINSLPIFSREFYLEPITASRNKFFPDSEPNFDVRKPQIERSPRNTSDSVAQWNEEGSAMNINTAHPYYKSLASTFNPNTDRGRKILREFERVAISEMLFEGFLLETGLDEHTIEEILRWRDRQFRLLAQTKPDSLLTLSEELRRASHQTNGHVFEKAVVALLKAMGFEAERDGLSGKKDILMHAPCGTESYKFIFEAKGKLNGDVENDKAEVSGAAAHRVDAQAEHAVIIARGFKGFLRDANGWPMVLKECQAVKDVSIMDVESLIKLAEVMNEYYYSLADVKELFTRVESPEQKLERISSLGDPFSHFDYSKLLHEIWAGQIEYGGNDPISYYDIWQKQYRSKGIDKEDFKQKLQALHILAYPLIKLEDGFLISLQQAPDKIIELMATRMDRPKAGDNE
ncbi:MAG: ATP-binding protein [Janthinobacterium lividum]